MNFRNFYLLFLVFLLFVACKGNTEENQVSEPKEIETKKYTRFRGSYGTFKDLHDLHLGAAQAKGIEPLENRADTARVLDELVKLPLELDLYKIHNLTHSIPYLVPDASELLIKISANFRDSLVSKNLPIYKLVVTSVTRTQKDVNSLTKRNVNASHNSAHCYGTTFDISWRRFQKRGPSAKTELSPDRLKFILAEVLHDLRERDRCYVVHERRQACFHITVR